MLRQGLELTGITPMNRTQIEHLAELASRFSARILLEHNNRIINGKSMLGLLSLGDTGSEQVTLVCDGEDEEQAARAFLEQLRAGAAPPKTEADAMTLMRRIKDRFASVLGERLSGIYLHGSLASGCFRWAVSDIDFLAVVKEPLELDTKMALIAALRQLEEEAPPKGIEMSVVLSRSCRDIPYPIPFELHYSPAHRAAYDRDPQAFCASMHGTDPDLTAHILALHAYGKALLGPDIQRMFDQVKREDALRAIRADAEDAAKRLHQAPVYCVLNLCRGLAYLKEGLVLDKKAGGQWALKKARQEYQPLIQAALNAYETGLDMTYDEEQAEDFCEEALALLKTEAAE